jgi:hypothetical protein
MGYQTSRPTIAEEKISREEADATFLKVPRGPVVQSSTVDFNSAAMRTRIDEMWIENSSFTNGPTGVNSGITFWVFDCIPYKENNHIQRLRSADADSPSVAVETWERVIEGSVASPPTSVTDWRKVVYSRGYEANKVLIGSPTGMDVESSPVTKDELLVLDGDTAATDTTLVDADGVVINDSGVMKQVPLSGLWTWIVSKITGAVSTLLTSNASASKAIVSNADGKLTASVTTSAELSNISGGTSASSVTLVDADKVVVNDDGVMKQVAMSAVSTYVNSKLPSTGGSTTGGYLSTSSSSWQNVTSSQDGRILVDLVYNSGNTQIRLRTKSGTTTAGYWSRINNSSGADTFTFGTSGTTFSIDHYVMTIWHSNKAYNLTAAVWQTGIAGNCIVSISQN